MIVKTLTNFEDKAAINLVHNFNRIASFILMILQMNDQQLGISRIKVVHAMQAIVKPTAKSNEAAQK